MSTSESEFQVGDVVRLKSGGPKMTIGRIESGSGDRGASAECHWIDSNGKTAWYEYKLPMLSKVVKKTGLGLS